MTTHTGNIWHVATLTALIDKPLKNAYAVCPLVRMTDDEVRWAQFR